MNVKDKLKKNRFLDHVVHHILVIGIWWS